MATTTTKTLFKMVIELKDNADPIKFAEIVDEMLACYKTYGEKKIEGSTVEFGFSVPKYFGGMMGVIMDIVESKLLKYINEFIWVDCTDNTYEDVLEELAEDL